MNDTIVDEVFGELTFTFAWMKEKYEQVFFGKKFEAGLIVEGNDDEIILDEQRESYKIFQENKSEIITKAEKAIYRYYNEVCHSIGSPKIAESEIINHIELTAVVFPMVINKGEISIGFLLEADCDPEHGIGIIIVNNEVQEVSTQDILT